MPANLFLNHRQFRKKQYSIVGLFQCDIWKRQKCLCFIQPNKTSHKLLIQLIILIQQENISSLPLRGQIIDFVTFSITVVQNWPVLLINIPMEHQNAYNWLNTNLFFLFDIWSDCHWSLNIKTFLTCRADYGRHFMHTIKLAAFRLACAICTLNTISTMPIIDSKVNSLNLSIKLE